MNKRNIWITILVAAILPVVGYIFIDINPWMGYTESAILYLAAVVGAGFYWLGCGRDK